MVNLLLGFAFLVESASAARLLQDWAMIMSHDAMTGYLSASDAKDAEVYAWTMTQGVPLTEQLECGARAFDWRPAVDPSTGALIAHHGAVYVNTTMASALSEVTQWLADKPDELAVLYVWDCEGDGCMDAARQALDDAGVALIDNCSTTLETLTVDGARDLGRLPAGGSVVALFDCVSQNYNSTLACSGDDPAPYCCYPTPALGDTSAYPLGRIFDYLLRIAPSPHGRLYEMQALWQETDASVIYGAARNSSLLEDEKRSQLNWRLAAYVANGSFTHINFLEVNHVCDNQDLVASVRQFNEGKDSYIR